MALKSSNKVDTNRYQLEVEIDGASFEKAVDQAYRKQNKKIMIPGFRKGCLLYTSGRRLSRGMLVLRTLLPLLSWQR